MKSYRPVVVLAVVRVARWPALCMALQADVVRRDVGHITNGVLDLLLRVRGRRAAARRAGFADAEAAELQRHRRRLRHIRERGDRRGDERPRQEGACRIERLQIR